MSIVAAALVRAINAKLLRRWVVEAGCTGEMTRSAVKALPAPSEACVTLPMPAVIYDRADSRSGLHAREFCGASSGKLVCDVHSGYEAEFECGVRNTTDSRFPVVSGGARLPLRVLDRPAVLGECRRNSAEHEQARATCGLYPFFFC
jgi:hypothetical protein